MPLIARTAAMSVAVLTLAGAISACARVGAPESDTVAETNLSRSNVRLIDLDGRAFDVWRPDRAAVTVVVFTRTDCPIANRYAPTIRQLQNEYQPRGAEFLLVFVDPAESPDQIRAHVREFGYSSRAVRDPSHTLVAHCEVKTTPEAVVFGRDGIMTYRGRIDDRYADLGRPRAEPTTHDLADAIEATVAGRPVANPRSTAVGCPIADLKD
jgi:hypothetical protein